MELHNAFCVVTATGVEGLLSNFFSKSDFGHAYLANMGAFDEYGPAFQANEVLFEKQTLNFCIDDPTPMHYLDLIFYAHNIAIDYLLNGELTIGYHPFNKQLSLELLAEWSYLHNEDFKEILKI